MSTVSDSGNDRSWDVARGASSLVVSSLVVSSNDESSGSALHEIEGAWSSRASKLVLSLDKSCMC